MNELIAERRKLAWREELRKSYSPKERTAIARAQMPELDPHYRITTLTEEVNQGLTEEQALVEARRCLDCAKPTCMEGCPVGIHPYPLFYKGNRTREFCCRSFHATRDNQFACRLWSCLPSRAPMRKSVRIPNDEETGCCHRLPRAIRRRLGSRAQCR